MNEDLQFNLSNLNQNNLNSHLNQLVLDFKNNNYDILERSKNIISARNNSIQLKSKLEEIEKSDIARWERRLQKNVLKNQIKANNALFEAGGDTSQLSKKQNSYLRNFSEVLADKKTTSLNNRSNAISGIGNALGTIGSSLPQNKLNQTDDVKAADAAFDASANAVSTMGPYGAIAGGIMKAGGFVTDTLRSFGVGTDQMTAADKALSSKFLSLTPMGLVNALGAKRSNYITQDESTLSQVGSAYGSIQNAFKYSGKKYGLFSRKARKRANEIVADANAQQVKMADIAESANADFAAQAGMTDVYTNAESFNSSGGFNERMSIGKKGMKIFTKDSIKSTKQLLKSSISKNQKGNKITKKIRSLDELIQYAKDVNPRFIQRLSESPKGIEFIDDNGNKGRGSHYLMWSTDDQNNAIIYPRIQEIDGELKFLDNKDAYHRAIKNKNYLIMSPEEAEIFFKEDSKYGTAYKKGWTNFFDKFKNGGSFNVIPEGALHARLHHMDMDGITKKGIPVVIKKEGGDVEQQAEIECDEIIFNLELTQKLEKLWKDGSDGAAIEAGKILAEEILHNTIDNTGLINKIEA